MQCRAGREGLGRRRAWAGQAPWGRPALKGHLMLQYANRSRPMNIAVVGAGWAGLAAAQRLKQYGHAVTDFEAAQTLGRRSRLVPSRPLQAQIDTGTYCLIGAETGK